MRQVNWKDALRACQHLATAVQEAPVTAAGMVSAQVEAYSRLPLG